MTNIIWDATKPYLYGKYKLESNQLKPKLALFDLDGTLILCKSGKRFAKDENDWKFYSDKNIKKELQYYTDNGYSIIIISNQAGLNSELKINQWKTKLNNIIKLLDIPIQIYASISHDKYRKPLLSLFNEIIKSTQTKIIINDCFYVGDACGRPTDHSDSDYKFALNCKLKFMTPEEVFLKEAVMIPPVNYPVLEEIKQYISNKNYNYKINKYNKEIILMVGMQGSGKSTFTTSYLIPANYVRINQDTLKTKVKCFKETEEMMKLNKNIVVDNTNAKKDTRAEFIKLANKYDYKVRCVIMDVSNDYAIHNANYRSYKLGIDFMPSIAFNMYKKNYEEPKLDEGFSDVVKIKPVIDMNVNNYDDYTIYF